MKVRELAAACGKLVEMGRADLFRAIRADIAVAHVIAVDNDNVGTAAIGIALGSSQGSEAKQQGIHARHGNHRGYSEAGEDNLLRGSGRDIVLRFGKVVSAWRGGHRSQVGGPGLQEDEIADAAMPPQLPELQAIGFHGEAISGNERSQRIKEAEEGRFIQDGGEPVCGKPEKLTGGPGRLKTLEVRQNISKWRNMIKEDGQAEAQTKPEKIRQRAAAEHHRETKSHARIEREIEADQGGRSIPIAMEVRLPSLGPFLKAKNAQNQLPRIEFQQEAGGQVPQFMNGKGQNEQREPEQAGEHRPKGISRQAQHNRLPKRDNNEADDGQYGREQFCKKIE
jgi:hypothetical protein